MTFLTVVCLASWIQNVESAARVPSGKTDWVRTIDGWESRRTLDVRAGGPHGEVHPALVAAFLLGASVFCLVAFPARVVVRSAASRSIHPRRRPAQAPAASSATAS